MFSRLGRSCYIGLNQRKHFFGLFAVRMALLILHVHLYQYLFILTHDRMTGERECKGVSTLCTAKKDPAWYARSCLRSLRSARFCPHCIRFCPVRACLNVLIESVHKICRKNLSKIKLCDWPNELDATSWQVLNKTESVGWTDSN